MMIRILSALALGAMTGFAMAEPAKVVDSQTNTGALVQEPLRLTDGQLDGIKAGRRDTDTTVFLGNSSNECTGDNCTVPGRKTETTSLNPGNPDNTNCNNCGTTTSSGPGGGN
jgi:hypothetical protein